MTVAVGAGDPRPITMIRAKAHADPRPMTPRRRLEIAIDAAIDLLNAMDGDPDLEDCADDEPSLCGVGMPLSGGAGVWIAGQPQYDLEEGAELL